LIKIIINEGEPIDKVLKKFKRKVEQSSILKDIKKREFYVKPSIKRKLKRRATNSRMKKREKKINKRLFFN